MHLTIQSGADDTLHLFNLAVERVISTRRPPKVSALRSCDWKHQMWRVMTICVRLTVILCVAEGVMLAGSRQAHLDPFAPYETIMPGQPSDALEHYPCNIYRVNASTIYCTLSLIEGPFTSVSVQYDHSIKRIDFVVRPDGLHLSDLILCWGAPTSVGPQNSPDELGWVDVEWGKELYAEIAADWNAAHLSYRLPVSYISIEAGWQGCSST